jgi:hypothetical protein
MSNDPDALEDVEDERDPLNVELDRLRQLTADQSRQINGLRQDIECTKANLAAQQRIVGALKTDLQAMETATLRYYAFASDEQIAAYAKQQPNEQAKKIADLTLRLRREMAGKQEIQAALGVMIQRMKTKVPAMTEEEFGKRYSS